MLLYDLTSSYVEGAGEKDPMLQRGYSRDHRPDCKQVVIALIVNVEGFPLSYETFDGNRADVSTLETVMRMVERKYGRARRVWVFDRGIVSEENLAALRRRNGQYLVGTPRSKLKQFEAELLAEGWERVRDDVEVKRVAMPGGEETYVLCRTTARREKEKAMRSRFSARMEKALGQLAQRVASGKLKDRGKIERRLGRIEARYPSVADLYQMQLLETEGRLRVDWQMLPERRTWQETREGAYLLRTNLQAESAAELWTKYMQLTEAEAAFRALKSALSIRPLFHQLEAARQSAYPGGLSRLRPVGDAETPVAAKAESADAGPRARPAGHRAKRRHRPAHHRRPRNPPAPRHHALPRTERGAGTARHNPSPALRFEFRM